MGGTNASKPTEVQYGNMVSILNAAGYSSAKWQKLCMDKEGVEMEDEVLRVQNPECKNILRRLHMGKHPKNNSYFVLLKDRELSLRPSQLKICLLSILCNIWGSVA